MRIYHNYLQCTLIFTPFQLATFNNAQCQLHVYDGQPTCKLLYILWATHHCSPIVLSSS